MADKEQHVIVVLDTETTGLDPGKHAVWEIGATELIQQPGGVWDELSSVSWQIYLTEDQISRAQTKALEINGFHERYQPATALAVADSAERLSALTAGCVVACNVPTFDIPFLEAHLREGGHLSKWNHRVIDIRSVLLGRLSVLKESDYRASLATLAYRTGFVQEKGTVHTARGDSEWSAGVLANLLSPQELEPVGWEGTD